MNSVEWNKPELVDIAGEDREVRLKTLWDVMYLEACESYPSSADIEVIQEPGETSARE